MAQRKVEVFWERKYNFFCRILLENKLYQDNQQTFTSKERNYWIVFLKPEEIFWTIRKRKYSILVVAQGEKSYFLVPYQLKNWQLANQYANAIKLDRQSYNTVITPVEKYKNNNIYRKQKEQVNIFIQYKLYTS